MKSENEKVIRENAAEIVHVMRWYISKNIRAKRMAMRCGGVSDCVQNAYIRLLAFPPNSECALTTMSVNALRWSLYADKKKISNATRVDLPDVACDHEFPVESLDEKEFLWNCVIQCGAKRRSVLILNMRMKGLTLEEIGKHFQITRERVRQIADRVIDLCQDEKTGSKMKQCCPEGWFKEMNDEPVAD